MDEILVIDPSEKFCTELSDALMKLGHVALYSRKLQEGRMLRGILHSCGNCRRIETPEGEWKPVEEFAVKYSEAMLSHGALS